MRACRFDSGWWLYLHHQDLTITHHVIGYEGQVREKVNDMDDFDTLIKRAANIIGMGSDEDVAITVLVETGVDRDRAYLATVAATILVTPVS